NRGCRPAVIRWRRDVVVGIAAGPVAGPAVLVVAPGIAVRRRSLPIAAASLFRLGNGRDEQRGDQDEQDKIEGPDHSSLFSTTTISRRSTAARDETRSA